MTGRIGRWCARHAWWVLAGWVVLAAIGALATGPLFARLAESGIPLDVESVAAYDRAFERIAEPSRRNWALYYSRGIALERSQEWDRAEKDFLKALEYEPEQPYVLNYLGYSWVERGKNLDQAQAMIERAVQQRQNDGYIVDSMGWVLYRLGKYQEAVTHLERAVQLRPQDPVINDHLGDAYWRVGRQHEARFQWHRALSFKPEDKEKSKIEAKLDNGMGPAEPIGKPGTNG